MHMLDCRSCHNIWQCYGLVAQLSADHAADAERSFCCAAFCNDVLVGAVAVRLERQPDGKARLYFVTLGVLAAYRNYGVGEPLDCSYQICFP